MIEFPDADSVDAIADWVELFVLREEKTVGKGYISSVLRSEVGEIQEERVDSAMTELERRSNLYGPNPPFEVIGNTVKPRYKFEDVPEYALCLIFSLYGASEKSNKGTKLFERLCHLALKNYLGGEAVTLGFPEEKTLTDSVTDLLSTLNELPGGTKPRSRAKDRGVDVVAWKSHGDNRSSQVVVLLQCGAGVNWRNKKQIPSHAWAGYIHWGVDPIPGIGIAKIIDEDKWNEVVDEYSLILDRARIYRSLYSVSISDRRLRTEVLKWCSNKIVQYE